MDEEANESMSMDWSENDWSSEDGDVPMVELQERANNNGPRLMDISRSEKSNLLFLINDGPDDCQMIPNTVYYQLRTKTYRLYLR